MVSDQDPRNQDMVKREKVAAAQIDTMKRFIANLPRSARRKLKPKNEGIAAMMKRLGATR